MEEKKEEGTCGSKGGCGIHCGCCACKTIKGLVLLLIGGVIGFGIARCGSHRMMCPLPAAAVQVESAPMPSTTTAPKKKGQIKIVQPPGNKALVRNLIRKSMSKWEGMDQAGRLAGRGLGRKELIDRVAKEVGTSPNQVQSALKSQQSR